MPFCIKKQVSRIRPCDSKVCPPNSSPIMGDAQRQAKSAEKRVPCPMENDLFLPIEIDKTSYQMLVMEAMNSVKPLIFLKIQSINA